MTDTDFDRERFDELAAKAESNDLGPEEIEEFREQYEALRELVTDVYGTLFEIITPYIEDIRESVRPFSEFVVEHPELMDEADVTAEQRDAIEDIAGEDSDTRD